MVYKRKHAYGGMRGYKRPSGHMLMQLANAMKCVEKKFKDFELFPYTTSTTWVLERAVLNGTGTTVATCTTSLLGCASIAQGDTFEKRHGKSIFLRSIQINIEVAAENSSATQINSGGERNFRILVVMLKNNNFLTPTLAISDLFATPSTAVSDYTVNKYWNAPRNMEKVDNYVILRDIKIRQRPITIPDTTWHNYPALHKKIVVKFKNPLEIVYAAENTTGSQAGLQDKDIHLLVVRNYTSAIPIYGGCRIKWQD